jgi:nucleotidyltransferase substrate binding protein (TIGR01987 family)
MQYHGIDIGSLVKATKNFQDFRQHLDSEQNQAGAIKAFDYTYELAWKTMKRILAVDGVIVNSPRESFRAAALSHLISDPEQWFEFLRVHAIVPHAYDEGNTQAVIAVFDAFDIEIQKFLKVLGAN